MADRVVRLSDGRIAGIETQRREALAARARLVSAVSISALDRKLLRDLVGMKGQALAIGMVLASGIAMYVTYLSNFDSLRRTRAVYYERFRFADVFASCKRAPLRLEERLREIPGVSAVDTRDGGRRDARPAGRARAREGPADLGSRPRSGRGSTTSTCVAAAGSSRGGDDEVLLNEPFGVDAPPAARRALRRADQRPAADADASSASPSRPSTSTCCRRAR